MKKSFFCLAIISILLALILVTSVSAFGPTAKLAADIQSGASGSFPTDPVVFDNRLFFAADDGIIGIELWQYDGTSTSLVADIHPTGSSAPKDLIVYNGNLYFNANNGSTGNRLWEYDGTNPPSVVAPSMASPNGMTIYNGELYFAGYLSPAGYELLKFDGTTVSVAADINTTASEDSDPYSLEVYNGRLYFQATDGINGTELWSFDGTTASLAADIHPTGSSEPDDLITYNGKLYFSANNGTSGVELWSFDGSTASQVMDIQAGNGGSFPAEFVVYGGKLYFTTNDSVDDYELWMHDGSTTSKLIDLNAGPDGSYPRNFIEYFGQLYFAAYTENYGYYELWSFDGTNASLAANIHPTSSSRPSNFAVFQNRLFFQANDGTYGQELWELSDTSGLIVVSTNPSGTTTINITQITVTFNEDVYDPVGNNNPDDVTNPANYILVHNGLDGTFSTTGCQAGVSGDDVLITVNSVSYNSVSFTATLLINGGVGLPNGAYRLVICGTTSIMDDLEQRLNDGADEIVDFMIREPALPDTGFAPGTLTALPKKLAALTPSSDLWLEIPDLDVRMDILGVPHTNAGWDVSWLGGNAGWLEGSAFPTWAGNTVLTGHVWNASRNPGPFINLKTLQHGDTIQIHAWGQIYTYEVRESGLVWNTQTSKVFQHEEYDWLTLLTCENWNLLNNSYNYRRMVRAVLVNITAE